jgi:hypothetical protein
MILIINITGKGNLAPSSASDQVQNYVLGGIIGGAMYNENVKIPQFLEILCIWCTMVLLLRWIKKHNVKAKQILDGKALIIIEDGKVNINNCRRVGLSAHDVSFKLRTNKVYSTNKVKRAVIEQDGALIIVNEGEENPKFPVITDGHVQTDILKVIGKDEAWLTEELNKRGIKSHREVFLGEYEDRKLHLTTYN